jgi:hypothetical protein
MTKAEDNPFPYITLVEGSTPATPSAGRQREFIDSADHKVKRVNSSGAVTTVEGSGSVTFIGARVYNTANISCATGTGVTLTFDSERYDTDTIHSTSSNTSRLTATTAGKYHITGQVMFANNTTGARGLVIKLNNTTELAHVRMPTVGGTDVSIVNISTTYDLAATDYVELLAYQTSGGNLNVVASGNFSPEFMMHKVG